MPTGRVRRPGVPKVKTSGMRKAFQAARNVSTVTVAVTGPAPILDEVTTALQAPVWAPYLGRRSCPPDAPFLLATDVEDPVRELERVPLNRKPPRKEERATVDFVYERQPADAPEAKRGELADIPHSFVPHHREYRTRPVFAVSRRLPAALCAGRGIDYLGALAKYLGKET